MEKKLLSFLFILFLFFLNPFSGFGQSCPSSVSTSTDPGTTVCEGTSITFKVTTTGGTNLKYQWKVGTTNVGTSSPEYTHTNPVQGQQISVVITSEDDTSCTNTRTFNSLTVNPLRTPTVSLSTNKTSICSGENITFNASNTNGGSGAKYDWYINGSNTIAKTGSSATFSSSDFNAGTNNVRVVLTSSLDCVTSETAETVSANIELKPDASISSPGNLNEVTCINSSLNPISFNIGGGGTGATVTGIPPGVSGSFNSGTYTLSGNPTTAGVYNYTVTTTGSCAQTSASGTITVNPNATLSLTSGNSNQTLCAAGGVATSNIEPIIYSVGETGNGAIVTNLPTGISGSYNNGTFTISGSSSQTGIFNFTVTATGSCGNSPTLNGSITLNENLAPSVSITSNNDEICEGTPVTFTATPINGGSIPTYQWQVNGNNVGTNSNTYTTSTLTNGQIVTVILTSNETCRTENTATSNGISTIVNENLEPSVTINPSDSEFCSGDEITYTAVPVNGGSSPTYQWKVGTTVVGSGPTFTSTNLTNGQSITVTLTSNETCVTSAIVVSDPVVTSVNENLVPSVTITSNDENNTICSGGNITFTATPTNGGSAPNYQWQINGSSSGNVTTLNTFSPNNLNNGDIVSVVLISNEECLAVNNVASNNIPVQVDSSISGITPEWDETNTSHNPTAICPVVSDLVYKIKPIAGATSYNWTFPNNGWSIVSGAGENEVIVRAGSTAAGGNISVQGVNECGSSNPISMSVTTGTVVIVNAGPDQTVCPGTVEINLNGEIGGVITQKKDWNWSDNGAGGSFKNNQGSDIKGIYTIPTSLRNGGTITITITSIDPPGVCGPKSDSMTLKIESAASITDATNKNQTVCLNSDIDNIAFTIGGAGKGATATGLPTGITGSFENGIFTLSGTPTVAGTFNYTVTTTGNCTNVARNGTITVNDRPLFTQPENIFACAGESIPTISFEGSNVTGTTYSWTNDNAAIGLATAGNGNITSFVATNPTNSPITANIIVTPKANNCEGTPQEFQITVYPTASMDKPEDLIVCNQSSIPAINFSGSSVNETTYNWTNDNINIGLSATGTGNIVSFTAVNNSSQAVTATITVTPVANGCNGTPETFSITVNPTTNFTQPEEIIICNNESTSEVIFSGGSVDGTNFRWTNDNTAIGLGASGTGNLPIFSATNSGTEPIVANITVTPEANECEGTPHTFQVIVNPTPVVTVPSTIILCNGEVFTGTNFSGNVDGISYTWSNTETSIGLGQSGEGNLPSFTAINLTDLPVTAVITVIPTANECEGMAVDFEVVINPSATVEAGPNLTICSNGSATMAAIIGGGATSGTWATSGSGSFSDNSVNSIYTPSAIDVVNGSVTLTYTTNDPDGPCGPVSDSLELTLNEEVKITTHPENIGVCSTEPSELSVIASGANLKYEWRRTDNSAITNATGINSSTLSFNNTTSTNAGDYYVVVTGEDSCEEAISDTVIINVDENIIIEEPLFPVPECGDGFSEVTMKFIAHANGAPLTFTWYKGNTVVDNNDPNITIITGEADQDGRYEGTLEIINVTTAYNGDYYVEIQGPDEFTCPTAVTNPFQLRLNEMPALPEVEEIIYCQGDEAEPLSVISGTNLTWYATATGDDAFTSTPTPDTSNFGETSYWVTQTPDVCESERVEVIVSVKEKPVMPIVENIEYCLGANPQELTATGVTGATLNWYTSEGEALTAAPTPATETAGDFIYYVSQTPNDGFGCESDRAEITVTIFPLPEVIAAVEDAVICFGSPALLTATGAETYIWYLGENEIGTGAQFSYTPEASGEYTLTLLGTDINGCENTTEIEIQFDEPTNPGTLSGPESVCVTSPNGDLTLADHTGQILRWEKSEDGGTTWTGISETTEILSFSGLTVPTSFRAAVKSGVCEELFSNSVDVTIDPLPVGGTLAFGEFGRMFLTCESPQASTLVNLELTGVTGQIELWEYKPASQNTWITITDGTDNYTEISLTANKIASLNLQETTAFRVKIVSGVCEAFAYSQTGILSIISSDIKPTPVTVDKEVICFDESVTLSASTGYESGEDIGDGGNFDNASITNQGWRIRKNGVDQGFSTSASNIRPDIWLRVTPREFITANINNNSTSLQLFDPGIDDGNKGFAIVSGNNPSTMETPVFSITDTDQAILQFDQAYNLTAGATISVEISTNGGATYETVLFTITGPASSGNYNNFATGTPQSRPLNKMEIDLGSYLGMGNLRIRFNFSGVRDGDVWTLDGITIPDGPANIGTVWKDYTQDPDNPTVIGTNPTETWTPTQIGWNSSVIITTLEYSNGSCETAVNSEEIKVFVFDNWTTSVVAEYGSCGNYRAQLSATATGAVTGITPDYPTPDGYMGRWVITGGEYQLANTDPAYQGDVVNNPNVTITAKDIETLNVSWELYPTARNEDAQLITNSECVLAPEILELNFSPCIALDFDGVDDFVDLGNEYNGNYSVEVWIRPEASTGTIISFPNLEINMADLPTTITPNSRWYHIAVSDGELYVDGILINNFTLKSGGVRALIGARWNNTTLEATNFFSGWIEEVRIWNGAISLEQIRFLMNQRLQNNANIGVEIPMPAPGLAYVALAGYYQLKVGEINNGFTPDLAGTAIDGRLKNMETFQENTAPLPYTSATDNVWSNRNTWTQPIVWDFPNSKGINGIDIEWNIVRTSNNITSGGKDITVLGLISESGELTIMDPNGTQNEYNSGQFLRVTHYLKLDGVIDLEGESQLLQDTGSIVDNSSLGYLDRDQQGNRNSYIYNYWSSPVSTIGSGSNGGYTIKNVLHDAQIYTVPEPITFAAGHAAADGARANPAIISSYWLYTYAPAQANEYSLWKHIGENGALKTAEGFTMKGTTGSAAVTDDQNYTFRGLPNNGDINLPIGPGLNYLIGNPYPSAIDARQFILDNMNSSDITGATNNKNVFDGAIYFWDHFEKVDHYLEEYIGGYATYNLTGGVRAVSNDPRINDNDNKSDNIPRDFIAVGQGFLVNSSEDVTGEYNVSGGDILFKNSQREFVTEGSGESIFLRPEVDKQKEKREAFKKIRLSLSSPMGYHRQILVGAIPHTTSGFDLGYDALLYDDNVEDMYWVQGDNKLVIQAVPNFDKNQVLPLGVKIKENKPFRIRLDTLENGNASMNIYLNDKLNDSIHDLRASAYIGESEPGTINERFEIIFYKEEVITPAPMEPGVEAITLSLRHSYTGRELQILNPDQLQINHLYLFDLNGNQLMEYEKISNDKEVRLPVRNYSSGVYILKLYTEKKIISKKIIINN